MQEDPVLEVVLALFDDYARQVHPAALRSEARWRSAYRSYKRWNTRRDFTTFEEELEYMRAWIQARWGLLSAQ
jgi:spore coat protein H